MLRTTSGLRFFILSISVFVVAVGWVVRGVPAADAAKPATAPAVSFDKDIQPLVTTYCAGCHNPDKQKGDLDLTQFTTAAKAMAAKDVWSAAGYWRRQARRLSQ